MEFYPLIRQDAVIHLKPPPLICAFAAMSKSIVAARNTAAITFPVSANVTDKAMLNPSSSAFLYKISDFYKLRHISSKRLVVEKTDRGKNVVYPMYFLTFKCVRSLGGHSVHF